MKSAYDIKLLRCSKGYFTGASLARAMEEKGVHISRASYQKKEKGLVGFSIQEIKVLAELLDLTIEEAVDFFS